MGRFVDKSFEYIDILNGLVYNVKAFIVSTPQEIEINDTAEEEYEGSVFNVNVKTQPKLPLEYLDTIRKYIFVILENGNHFFGCLENETFIELEENPFIHTLIINILETLLSADDY